MSYPATTAGRDRPRARRLLPLLIGLSTVTAPWSATPPLHAQQVTGDEVRIAMEAAQRWLLRQQQPDGAWAEYRMTGGATALTTLALLNAGLPPDHDQLRRALPAVRRIPLQQTYTVALKILALAAADPETYRQEIDEAARWLAAAQQPNGLWGYDTRGGHTDFSNTQFALLGLHEAAQAGAEIEPAVWRRAERAWIQAQHRDGGWGYTPDSGRATGSMTTAALASLYITGQTLETGTERGFTADGEAPGCGRYTQSRPIARGLHWMSRNFRADRNPGTGAWYFYYLYGVERVGILSGIRHFGPHDWYRAGAARLVRLQQPDGHWREHNAVVDTAFGLLFLAKGHRPVLFHKLQWSNDNRWNLDRNDLANLCAFIDDRLGEPVSWEVAPLDADVTAWLTAPILYFNGHEFPAFKEADIDKLREFVRQGGTLLAEACCGRQAFRDGFDAFAREAFPEHPISRLNPDHPVFRAHFHIDAADVDLRGLDVGCRTSVFFSPDDLSCLWEQGDIPGKSRAAFELGTNIAAYATGNEPLPDKLDVVRMAERTRFELERETPPRGAVYIAQIMHNGDWRPDPKAIPHLADHLHEALGVDVIRRYEAIDPVDPRLARHPIAYMTGHYSFSMTPEQTEALRRHLERGGFLWAEACCGRQPFDRAFRAFATQLFPDHPLERLPADHPIIRGSPGVALSQVAYTPAVLAETPDLSEMVLEGIAYEGRTVLVYSRYGLGCGLDGHTCYACRGLTSEHARNVAGNIILHALSY